VVGDLPDSFIGASAGETRVAKLQVRASSRIATGGSKQHRRKNGIHHARRRRILIVARETGVNFVQQVAAVGVTPSSAGVVVAHEGVGEGALAEERRLRAENKSVGGVEAIPVQAEIEAVILGIAVVNFREQRPVQALPLCQN